MKQSNSRTIAVLGVGILVLLLGTVAAVAAFAQTSDNGGRNAINPELVCRDKATGGEVCELPADSPRRGTPEQIEAANAPNQPVADKNGATRGYIAKEALDAVTRSAATDDPKVAPVTDEAGGIVGYFGPVCGFIERSKVEVPDFSMPALMDQCYAELQQEKAAH
jgi:hypothetical protein